MQSDGKDDGLAPGNAASAGAVSTAASATSDTSTTHDPPVLPTARTSAAMAHAASVVSGSKARGASAAQRRVGCAVVDQATGALLGASCNVWDNPILPGKGVCAELVVLSSMVVRGALREDGDTTPLTLAVTTSPCMHCAATILLFEEVVEGEGRQMKRERERERDTHSYHLCVPLPFPLNVSSESLNSTHLHAP